MRVAERIFGAFLVLALITWCCARGCNGTTTPTGTTIADEKAKIAKAIHDGATEALDEYKKSHPEPKHTGTGPSVPAPSSVSSSGSVATGSSAVPYTVTMTVDRDAAADIAASAKAAATLKKAGAKSVEITVEHGSPAEIAEAKAEASAESTRLQERIEEVKSQIAAETKSLSFWEPMIARTANPAFKEDRRATVEKLQEKIRRLKKEKADLETRLKACGK